MAGSGEHHDCKEVFAMLSEYLDAELDHITCEEIEQHLANCPPCIDFLNSLKRSIKLCHECEPQMDPPPLTQSQRDQLRAAYQKTVKSRGQTT